MDASKEGGKMRINEVSPFLAGALVIISWIGIALYVFPTEEKMRIRADDVLKRNEDNNLKQAAFTSAE